MESTRKQVRFINYWKSHLRTLRQIEALEKRLMANHQGIRDLERLISELEGKVKLMKKRRNLHSST